MTPGAAHRRLAALDSDDLCVISTHVQDARVKVSDIVWREREKRVVIGMRRIDWDQALTGTPGSGRLISALRFDRVLACKSRNIDLSSAAELDLIGIEFSPTDPPGGSALILFAGGGALRLDLECLECELADLGRDKG